MARNKVRLGFLGAGWWATANHMPLLAGRDDVEMVAVCRLGAEELRRVKESFGFRFATENAAELVHHPDLDAVIVSSPHTLHHAHAKLALERGLRLDRGTVHDGTLLGAATAGQLVVLVLGAGAVNQEGGRLSEPQRPVEQHAGEAPYVVVPYLERMDLAYAAADLVVCRAGANTVCELTAVGLPAVYVPLPIGNGVQRFNAADVLAAGGGLLVDDASFTPEWLSDNVIPLAQDGDRLRTMGDAAASVGQRDADEALADLVYRAHAERP